jgi:hypothetical protein
VLSVLKPEQHEATTKRWWLRASKVMAYCSQLGIGLMSKLLFCLSGVLAALFDVNTVVFVKLATTGALPPFAAIFAITPPSIP